MGYKTTTDPFILRGAASMDITGTSASGQSEIDTSLDTLNREVLLIWEIDIAHGDLPRGAMDSFLNNPSLCQFVIKDQVQTVQGAFSLNDQEYIGGKEIQFSGRQGTGATQAGVGFLFEQKNPNSTDFPSRDKAPLAIVTASSLFLRTQYDASISVATTDVYAPEFRIHAQRAKADADTYAALVTGLM